MSLCKFAAIKDMAQNIERRWRQLLSVPDAASKMPEVNTIEGKSRSPVVMIDTELTLCSIDTKNKKRKLNEPPPSKAAPPAKKLAVASSATSRPTVIKKEVKPVVTSVKDAKSDSSFFSNPKPKPKLPSFKKAPIAKKEPVTNIAQPSSFDPFQEALKSMAKTRKESPAMLTPPPLISNSSSSTFGLTKSGQKKKTVTWAPDEQLESIRIIDKAIYDDDPVDVSASRLLVAFVAYANSYSILV